ncbi:hypothetical protein C1H46_020143 [Malus baccata]|uniref:Uncharacterized protein n=1 Tax=Malus baccata TaxID=106549 RepID=A0A540M753_MALBA|nr:hypothetical protein C1H46_020143 [Malus baccata]
MTEIRTQCWMESSPERDRRDRERWRTSGCVVKEGWRVRCGGGRWLAGIRHRERERNELRARRLDNGEIRDEMKMARPLGYSIEMEGK